MQKYGLIVTVLEYVWNSAAFDMYFAIVFVVGKILRCAQMIHYLLRSPVLKCKQDLTCI